VVLCVAAPPPPAWEVLLPAQARYLPDELAKIDAYLDDEQFITPWRVVFSARLGCPSVSVQTLLRLLYLKHRYQLGYETLCREVADSIGWPLPAAASSSKEQDAARCHGSSRILAQEAADDRTHERQEAGGAGRGVQMDGGGLATLEDLANDVEADVQVEAAANDDVIHYTGTKRGADDPDVGPAGEFGIGDVQPSDDVVDHALRRTHQYDPHTHDPSPRS
jgi:hypothetical protein